MLLTRNVLCKLNDLGTGMDIIG